MKFRRMAAIVLLVSVALAFVSANDQKYYAVSSPIWQRVNDLCHLSGTVGPSSFGPVTGTELQYALDRAESRLGNTHPLVLETKALLEEEKSFYSDDLGYLSLSANISPEVYLQSNDAKTDSAINPDENWFIKNYSERKPLVSVTLENGLYDHFYGKFVMDGKQKKYISGFWEQTASSNVSGAPLSQNFPFEAGISIGVENMNLIIGRDHVSLGEGKTGNTAIGDVFDFQEFLKASFFTRNTGVHLNITSFDSSHNTAITDPFRVDNTSFSGWRQIRHTVDYEIVLMDKLKFSLAFVGLWDTDNAFDIRMLNPFMVFHSMYNFHEKTILEANNIITLDVSYTFAPKWNLYAQVTMDQFQIVGEVDGYVEEFGYTDPNAFGGLLNVSYTEEIGIGLLNAYGELVVNGPAMYLNEKYYDANGNVTQHRYDGNHVLNRRCWSQDYLVGYTRTDEDKDQMAFAGYTYGPDCVVIALGADYAVLNQYSLSTQLFYMAHGEKGRGNDVSNYDFSGLDAPKDVNKLPLVDEQVEHTFAIKAEGTYALKDWLELYSGFGYTYRINNNFSGANSHNLQLAVGLTLKTF